MENIHDINMGSVLRHAPETFFNPKYVPVAWDETKLLSGYQGKDVVIARRRNDRRFIAGING